MSTFQQLHWADESCEAVGFIQFCMSAVMRLSPGMNFHTYFTANVLLNLWVKEFWKSVNIWRIYEKEYIGSLFDSSCTFLKNEQDYNITGNIGQWELH